MPQPVRQDSHPTEDELIDVRTYVRLFAEQWVLVAVIVILATAAGVALATMRGPRYEAEMLLGVSSTRPDRVDRVADLASVATLLESQVVLAGVLTEFKLDQAPHRFTITSFRRDALEIDPVANAEYLKVKVTLSDPELAAKVANALGLQVLVLSRSISQGGATRAQDDLQQAFEHAAKKLETAQQAHQDYRSSAQIELARKDVDQRLDQRGTLNDLLIELESERARLADIRAEMAKRQRIGTLSQSVADNPAMAEAVRQSNSGSNPLKVQMKSEYVDAVYEQLEQELTTRQANVAALEKMKTELGTVRKLDRPQLQELTRLYEREDKLARLETERELARRAYTEAAAAYQGAQLKLAGRLPILQLVDPALTPTESSTGRGRAGLLGMIAGFLIAFVAVLGRHALRPRS